VRAYSLDDYWELLAASYDTRGRRVPLAWRLFYRVAVAILRWGARGR